MPKSVSKDTEKMLVWMLLWSSGVMAQRDMRGKLFAFPNESSSSNVELLPEKFGPFQEVTVCLRFHSPLTRDYSLFSLSTSEKNNAFLLYYSPGSVNKFSLSVNNEDKFYELQDNNFTEWTSTCATCNSSAWVVWIDGKKYHKTGTPNVKISDSPIIIIGQKQNTYGGGFRASQSFVGEITDINMWDKVLTDEVIIDYIAGDDMSGNVLNWSDLNYNLFLGVKEHPYIDPYPCIPV